VRYPDEPALYEALGKVRLEEKDFAGAEAVYRRIVTDTADNARGYFLLGQLHQAKGDRDQARENFKKAALLNRGYRNHFNRMLSFDLLLAEYFKSTRDYKRLKSLIPLAPANLQEFVLYLYRNNAWLSNRAAFLADLEAAKEQFAAAGGEGAKAARARPWLTAYYMTLAEIYLAERKTAKAVALMEELTAVDPDNAAGHMFLARKKAEGGAPFDEIAAHFEKAIALSPKETAYRQAYARALAGAGRFDEAEAAARAALEKRPKDPELHETLGDIYALAGKNDLAADAFTQALTLSKGADRYRQKLIGTLPN
jgi:tetratricopeptide (TPR) repeat protein